MERKTKHRILGILVVVGLVIILLPLFQSTSEAPAETNLIQAPPFPDQAAQTPEQAQTPSPQEQDMVEPQPLPIQDPSQDGGISAQPDDTVNADSPAQGTMPAPSNPANATPTPIAVPETKSESPSVLPDTSSNDTNAQPANQALTQNTAPASQVEDAANRGSEFIYKNDETPSNAAQTVVKPTAAKAKKKSAHKLVSAKKHLAPLKNADEDGLFKLKGSVWVIQMGSFNNKANAIRLVNKLRENGYAAFIQQMASSTRVFVGPESKQTHARTLASKIHSEMHMQGIVISYKPLAI